MEVHIGVRHDDRAWISKAVLQTGNVQTALLHSHDLSCHDCCLFWAIVLFLLQPSATKWFLPLIVSECTHLLQSRLCRWIMADSMAFTRWLSCTPIPYSVLRGHLYLETDREQSKISYSWLKWLYPKVWLQSHVSYVGWARTRRDRSCRLWFVNNAFRLRYRGSISKHNPFIARPIV